MASGIWYLQRCPLFERLADDDAAFLSRRALVRRFARKETVYAPAEASDAVLALTKGRVKIHDLTPDGRETILAFVEAGELFGELAALNGSPRRDYAEAVEPSEALAIPRTDFLELLARRPELGLSVSRLMGLRRERVETRLRNILFLPMRDRLLRTLVELVESHGEPDGNGWALRFPLSHADLANLIGATRETVTATLGQLALENLVAVRRRRVVVLDWPGLCHAAGQTAAAAPNARRPAPLMGKGV